ncbi:hypothetical protein [Streptomyces sp. NPDC021224]|uniref:hypothetical protein n=1 Tax=unclassified Streptomyces TaxID=2593676 RepID=UPI0037B54CCF
MQRAVSPLGSRTPLGDLSDAAPMAPAPGGAPATAGGLPVVQRAEGAADGGPGRTAAAGGTGARPGTATPGDVAVQRAVPPLGGRSPLGPPLTQLPDSAQPVGPAAGMPVVQRAENAADGTGPAAGGGSGTTARGGDATGTAVPGNGDSTVQRAVPPLGGRTPLGAPVPRLPDSAGPTATAPSGGLPVVQRAEGTAEAPAPPAAAPRPRSGLGAPLPAMPATAEIPGAPRTVRRAPAAPVLGPTDLRPRTPEAPAAPARPANTGAPAGPAAPLVRRPAPTGPPPVVVARSLAAGSGGAHPLTLFPARAHTPTQDPTAGRALPLLTGRGLTPSTRAPEGAAPPPAAAAPPVVAPRWPGAPGPGVPQVQRAETGSAPPPLVRPAAPAAPVPSAVPGALASAGAPPVVPLVQPRPTAPGGSAGPSSAPPVPVVPVVQRSALNGADFGLPPGVPVTAVPKPQRQAQPQGPSQPVQRRTAGLTAANGQPQQQSLAQPQAHGTDPAELDDLARRLLEPVSRLLRTELRRGRDRIGRPHDGRR